MSVFVPGGSADLVSNVQSGGSGSTFEGLGRLWNDISGATATNQFNALEAEKARAFNSAEALKQREFEAQMSNTAYQRAAADMKAAGINPASLGGNAAASPASTPSGASAQGVAASSTPGHSGGFVGVALNALSMALKMMVFKSALGVKEAGLDLKKFDITSKAALNKAKIADLELNSSAKAALQAARTRNTNDSAELKEIKIHSHKNKIDSDRAFEEARKKEYERVKKFIHTNWVEK